MSHNLNSKHIQRVHLPAHLMGLFGAMTGVAVVAASPTWGPALALVAGFAVANFWLSGLGISIGYHRYFAHRSFKASLFWSRVMLLGGTLAGQGSVIFWTALHRQHHHRTDEKGDPHSPKVKATGETANLWHAYMGWVFEFDPQTVPMFRAQDVARDAWARFTHRHYHRILWAWWIVLALAMVFGNPLVMAVAAGTAIAGTWSIHQEAWINSFCHDPRFGQLNEYLPRRKSSDGSRDILWMRFVTWGQSLHNSHHLDPGAADFGWWLFHEGKLGDPGYAVIKLIRQEVEA